MHGDEEVEEDPPKESEPEEQAEEDKAGDEVNRRSIFVGNVHFSASTEELRALFKDCGDIERVTIPVDFSKHPKGYAYIEFAEESAVLKAQSHNDKDFKGRKLKVIPKKSGLQASRSRRPYSRRGYFYRRPRRTRYYHYR